MDAPRVSTAAMAPADQGIRAWVVLSAVLALVGVTYAGVLDAPLLWDDWMLLEHPAISKLRPIGEYLFVPFWDMRIDSPAGSLFYRPLTTFSLAIDVALHGGNPSGFHLTNLLLHWANVACVFCLVRRMRGTALVAGAAALGWGVMPRLAESVSWISGRTDALGALGVLGALLVWRRGNAWRVALASALALAGMLGKEMAVAGALAIVVGELWPRLTPRAWLRALLPMAVLGLFVALRTHVAGHVAGPSFVALDARIRVLTVLEALGRYAFMTIDPWQPRTQIGMVGRPSIPFAVGGLVVLVAALLVAWRYGRRLEGFSAALVVAGVTPLLLVIHVIPLPWNVVASDRLMYLPWAVLLVGVAVGYGRLRLGPRQNRAIVVGWLGLVLTLGYRTRARSAMFGDEVEFWIDALETTPHANRLPSLLLSEVYTRGGLYAQALEIVDRIMVREQPEVPIETIEYRSRAIARVGRYREAYLAYRQGHAGILLPRQLLDQSLLALHLFDVRQATELAEQASRKLPGYQRARDVLDVVARVDALRRHLDQEPTSRLDADLTRARLAMLAGRGPEAEQAWLELLEDPNLAPADLDEGFAFIGRLGSAVALRRALEIYPKRPSARSDLLAAAEERHRMGERLAREWPRVERALDDPRDRE
jgi:protein O-mannosyl-transferase